MTTTTIKSAAHRSRDPQNWAEALTEVGLQCLGDWKPSITEVADADKYADYAVEIVYSTTRVHEDEPLGNNSIRWCGWIAVFPTSKKFQLQVPQRSHDFDLSSLQREAEKIRDGWFNARTWTALVLPRTGEEVFYARIGYLELAADPFVSGDEIVPCEEAWCQDNGRHHLGDRDDDDVLVIHTAESFVGEYGTIEITKVSNDVWRIDPHIEVGLSAAAAADLVNDLEYALAAVKNLNEKDAA